MKIFEKNFCGSQKIKAKILRFLAICLVLFGVYSCGPSQKEIANAYYGPFPEKYEKIIRDFVVRITIDPDPNTTHIKCEKPVKSWMQNQREPLSKREFGWLIKTRINAKNKAGGYTGDRPWDFLIRDGQIILIQSIDIDTVWAKPTDW